MCERSHVRLQYLARSSEWCNNKVHACNQRKAKNVSYEKFLSETKDCLAVQSSPCLVSFYRESVLIGQAVWLDIEGTNALQFRLLLA